MKISSKKKVLRAFNKRRWIEFIKSENDEVMHLPEVSIIPGRSASTRIDTFTKQYISENEGQEAKSHHHVKVIKKDNEPAAFVWQTSPEKLKEAVRWGVIHADSITGKVIGALGQYRVSAHEIIAKGMIGNSHRTKMALLDLYQNRFEKLEVLESLANQPNSIPTLINALSKYIEDIEKIKKELNEQFSATDINQLAPKALEQIVSDIDDDIRRTRKYIDEITSGDVSLREVNRGRGNDSIVEFVKTQMLYSLYEFQGINQDISYTLNRDKPAFTRGRMNDFIEDARKEINDHHPDQRNLIGDKHHGYFNETNKVIYDFSKAHLTAEKERQAMLAVSFIEGWDKVEWRKPANSSGEKEVGSDHEQAYITNKKHGDFKLKEIAATRWQVSRNWRAFARKIGVTLLNMVKSFVVPTKPWQEDALNPPGTYLFHLISDDLQEHSRLNNPIWHAPVDIIKRLGLGFIDIFHGIYDTGKKILSIPESLYYDWYSTHKTRVLLVVQREITDQITHIEDIEKQIENDQLKEIIDQRNTKYKLNLTVDHFKSQSTNETTDVSIAHQDYHLTAGEANDILNSLVRGVAEFSEFFTHQIFAKNPVAGALFLSTYGLAGAAILAPGYVAFLGPKFVALETTIGYTLGGGKMSAAIAAGSITGQVFVLAVEGAEHGPGSMLGNIVSEFVRNPLKLATMIGVAYGTGYLLAEGVAGYRIPVIGDILHEEVNGSTTNYIILGAKGLILTEALFHKQVQYKFVKSEFEFNGDEIIKRNAELYHRHRATIEKFKFIKWLSDNYRKLPKLSAKLRSELEGHIDEMFDKSDAKSLRKLIKKEKVHTIAYQLLAIPLNYIPAFLRMFTALGVTIVALISGQAHPFRPIINSTMSLYNQGKKDISRLILFAAELGRLLMSIATSVIKIFAFIISMSVSRLGAVVDRQSGHGFHRFFAHAHVALHKFGEWIYPNDVARSAVSAHPKSTVMRFESSYRKIFDEAFKGDVNPSSMSENSSDVFPILSSQNSEKSLEGFPGYHSDDNAECDSDAENQPYHKTC